MRESSWSPPPIRNRRRGTPSSGISAAPPTPTRLTITVAATFPVWQQSVVRIMSAHYTAATRTFADERTLLEAFKGDEAIKKQMKRVMTFVATIKVRCEQASANKGPRCDGR